MQRNEVQLIIQGIHEDPAKAGLGAVNLTLSDGRRHTVQTWTVEYNDTHLKYLEVHMQSTDQPLQARYENINKVEDFQKSAD